VSAPAEHNQIRLTRIVHAALQPLAHQQLAVIRLHRDSTRLASGSVGFAVDIFWRNAEIIHSGYRRGDLQGIHKAMTQK
jgi:hypothetical protein